MRYNFHHTQTEGKNNLKYYFDTEENFCHTTGFRCTSLETLEDPPGLVMFFLVCSSLSPRKPGDLSFATSVLSLVGRGDFLGFTFDLASMPPSPLVPVAVDVEPRLPLIVIQRK